MEKRISFRDFQSVKSVAKAIDPKLREKASIQKKAIAFKDDAEKQMAALKERLDAKAAKIKEEYDNCQAQIDALEAGVLAVTGFHVTDLVKKVIEPTGATDKDGRPIKVTKYLSTDIVSYDETTKEFVISVPEEPTETTDETASNEESVEEPTEESQEEVSEEPVEEETTTEKDDDMPW